MSAPKMGDSYAIQDGANRSQEVSCYHSMAAGLHHSHFAPVLRPLPLLKGGRSWTLLPLIVLFKPITPFNLNP